MAIHPAYPLLALLGGGVIIPCLWITAIEFASIRRDEPQPEVEWRWRIAGAAVTLVGLSIVRFLTDGQHDAGFTGPAFLASYSLLGAIFVDRILWIVRYKRIHPSSHVELENL